MIQDDYFDDLLDNGDCSGVEHEPVLETAVNQNTSALDSAEVQQNTASDVIQLSSGNQEEYLDDDFDDEDLMDLPILGSTFLSAQETQSKDVHDPEISICDHGDDDYPMDDIDEADLADLADLQVDDLNASPEIVEAKAPPSDWHPSGGSVQSRDEEIYDRSLQRSPVQAETLNRDDSGIDVGNAPGVVPAGKQPEAVESEDWTFLKQSTQHGPSKVIHNDAQRRETLSEALPIQYKRSTPQPTPSLPSEYRPLSPFARPPFPSFIRVRSPVVGLNPSTALRTCFRIGEALRAGTLAIRSNTGDIILELFCRVIFSYREEGTTRQHFQFGDLFHGNPPFVSGLLENVAVSRLQDMESKVLLTAGGVRYGESEGQMVRVLGQLRRVLVGVGWVLHVSQIRETDWEEVRWTKGIAGAGEVKR
jgi:hypothetical protein